MSKFVYTDDDLLEIEEPVLKHGEHDQKTHGNWADSGSPKLTIMGQNDGVNEFFNERTRVVRYQPEGKEPTDYVLYADGLKGDTIFAIKKPTDGTTIDGWSGKPKGVVGHLDVTRMQGNPWRRNSDDGKSTIVEVAVSKPHQRRGLATAMLRFHRDLFPEQDLQHSDALLPDGQAWAEVAKHGEHDQKTHGNWATGGTVYTSIIDRLSQKNVTGFSLDISSRNAPQSGYMTSDAGAEESVSYDDFFSSRDRSRAILLEYIEKNAQALSDRGAYFGIWVVKDQGTVYLDVSRRYDTRAEAVRAGFANEQQSVYDIENDEYIYMKDEEDDRTNKAVDGGSSNPRQSNDPGAEASLRGGDSQRNRKESPHICLGRHQGVEKHLEGQHDQATHGSWASGRFGPDSVKSARDGAKEYAFKAGIKQDDSIDYQKTVANRARAARIADAYDELPTVQEEAFPAYTALATEVEAQFEYMTKTLGIKVEFVAEDPYKTSREMFADVSRGVLKVLSTASTGSHPFLSDDQNDKFRAVHDYFGHAATGRGFGQDGEESAWVHHSQMFTETARGALTTETRGQNSWYNSRGKVFAEQKVALLPKEFWEVPDTFEKSYKVIKFQAGLTPIFKHGEHDQKTHGNWAKAGYSEDQQRRMKEFQGVGPSLQDILSILNGAEQPDSQDLIDYVNNDQEEYKLATEGIDERVAERLANLQAEFPNHEYTEQEKSTIYEDIQDEMIQEHVDADDGSIARAWQEQNGGGGATPEELLPFFEEVYNFEHTGLNLNGVEHTVSSEVKTVEYEYGRLIVKGYLTNEDNTEIGRFERQFYVDEDGNVAVEHKLFTFYDDGSREEYAGTGFGKEFILNQEAWATQAGIDNITVFTGWDGARHWARAGYDWDEANIDISFEEIVNRADYFFTPDSPERAQFDDIIDRATVGYIPMSLTETGTDSSTFTGVRDMADDDFPIPAEIANIGYTPGAKTWVGKELLENLNIYYKKNLQTAEGQSIIQGPVDRDGDGLVYDGTPREKPAPSKQGQDVAMSREQKLQAITDNYLANAVDFDGLTDEEESKIMDGVSTILKNNKQQLKMYPLLCIYGGYCTKTHRIKR